MEQLVTIVAGLVIIGFAWYFVRTVAKILVNLSKAQENHQQVVRALEDLKAEIRSLKETGRTE